METPNVKSLTRKPTRSSTKPATAQETPTGHRTKVEIPQKSLDEVLETGNQGKRMNLKEKQCLIKELIKKVAEK